jgi:hypothetical protein
MDKVMSYLPTGNRPHVAIWCQAELDAKFSESKDVFSGRASEQDQWVWLY